MFQRGSRSIALLFLLTSVLDWIVCSTPHPGCFTSGEDTRYIIQEAGWAPGPVWAGAENFTPTGVRSSDRLAGSELLYRLSYSDTYLITLNINYEFGLVLCSVGSLVLLDFR